MLLNLSHAKFVLVVARGNHRQRSHQKVGWPQAGSFTIHDVTSSSEPSVRFGFGQRHRGTKGLDLATGYLRQFVSYTEGKSLLALNFAEDSIAWIDTTRSLVPHIEIVVAFWVLLLALIIDFNQSEPFMASFQCLHLLVAQFWAVISVRKHRVLSVLRILFSDIHISEHFSAHTFLDIWEALLHTIGKSILTLRCQ